MKGEWKQKTARQRMSNAIQGKSKPPSTGVDSGAGTSIFDPVLCELAYRWFSPKGGNVLDPFAGGSVRGIVASKIGRQYVGIDLREEQIKANQEQGLALCSDPMPAWICGDSVNIIDLVKDYTADLIFSCPPYGDLEVYSDNPQDISTMEYSKFLESYYSIIKRSVSLLKQDRFACFVVGDFRDKKGIYRNFVSHTIDAFIQAGTHLYNEAILVTSLGSLPIRAGKAFSSTRKMGKTHQNVLVFIKGDPRKATEACGEVEITAIDEDSGVTASE
jgi:DNA modification methylase